MTRLEMLSRDKRSRLFSLCISDEEKQFYNIETRSQCYVMLFFFAIISWSIYLPLGCLSDQVFYFQLSQGACPRGEQVLSCGVLRPYLKL